MAVIGSRGSAVLIGEQDKLDFDSVPEYVREPRSNRDSAASKSYYSEETSESLEKSAEIETLWPGVSADFLHGNVHKKQPSFYWGVGFASGVVSTIVSGAIFFAAAQMFTHQSAGKSPQIVVASAKEGVNQVKGAIASFRGAAPVTTRVSARSADLDVISPIYQTYTVRNGDTLASIAIQAYKRATPRLLDEICRANGMRNANVLSLGQTLTLPQYRPQTRQIASGAVGVQ